MKLMIRTQIPLTNPSSGIQNEGNSWQCRAVEKLIGRKLGDFGDPEDIAEAAAFLASPRARYMSGACVDVNGGLL